MIFAFHLNRHISAGIIAGRIEKKKDFQWLLIETLILLDYGRKIIIGVYIDTYFCKPELKSWR